VSALTCGNNTQLFREQLNEFKPALAVCKNKEDAERLAAEFPGVRFLHGPEGLAEAAAGSDAKTVVNALLGMMGLRPTYEAIRAGKDIAFANKETLVAGGALIMKAVRKSGVKMLPVDSEHSAIFQCLQGNEGNPVRRILLTASGGPFRGFTAEQMRQVTRQQALKHPRWTMGAKITIDSADMVNKALEVMEAHWLFNVDYEDIQVVIQPQSIIHSMVEYEDGAVIAQLGVPDMKLPIQYALYYPDRRPMDTGRIDFFGLKELTFEEPDTDTFPGLSLAYRAARTGGSMRTVFNAANEEAVRLLIDGKIRFSQIPELINAAMDAHDIINDPDVDDILRVEAQVIRQVEEMA
jgi:1-deoxy-D-xylulose-5-phosphate reductoisomerase